MKTGRGAIYLAAAKLINKRSVTYSCIAINRVTGMCAVTCVFRERYGHLFSPFEHCVDEPTDWWNSEEFTNYDREARLTALCLMAAIADAGDDV